MYDIETCLAFITNSAAKRISDACNEQFMRLGITRIQWIALYYLGDCEYMTQTELAQKLNIKNSTCARLVDRMERDGHVYRGKDKIDRRTINLMITADGRQMRERVLPEGEKWSSLISKDISEEEIITFKKVLNKMIENIEGD